MRSIVGGLVLQLRTVALTPLALVTAYLTPLSIAFLVISRFGRPTLALMIGTIAAAVLNGLIVQTFFAVRKEQSGGTMQILAATPSGLLLPLAGRLVGIMVQGLAAVPLTGVLVVTVWGPADFAAALDSRSLLLAIASLLMAICGTFAMAVVHVGMIIRSVSYRGLVNAIFPVSIVVAGLFTPTNALPTPVRVFGRIFPPTWAMEGVYINSYRPMLFCAATTVAWAGAGVWLLLRLLAWLRTSPDTYTR